MLVPCGFSVSFLLSFRLTFVFHAPSAPSSFCCFNIRIETQSRACVDVCQGPGENTTISISLGPYPNSKGTSDYSRQPQVIRKEERAV